MVDVLEYGPPPRETIAELWVAAGGPGLTSTPKTRGLDILLDFMAGKAEIALTLRYVGDGLFGVNAEIKCAVFLDGSTLNIRRPATHLDDWPGAIQYAARWACKFQDLREHIAHTFYTLGDDVTGG